MFHLWLENFEQKNNWFANIPPQKSVGDFLLIAKNLLQNKLQTEAVKSFPIPSSVVDFAALTPRSSDLAHIGQVLRWVLEDGLFEALSKRKKLAAKASVEFSSKINEHNIYSKEIWNNKKFQQWLKQNEIDLEPNNSIKVRINDQFVVIEPKEINDAIDNLNEQYGDLIQMQKLQYAGDKGFIQHIENGEWSSGNQPNETGKTGFDLSSLAAVEKNDNKSLELGDLNLATRKKGGSYERSIREMTQRVVSQTINGLNKSINVKQLSPEDQSRLNKLVKVLKQGSVDFKQGSYSISKGYGQKNSWQAGDDKTEAVMMGVLMRLGIARNVEIYKIISGLLSKNTSEQNIREVLVKKLDLSPVDLKNVFSQSKRGFAWQQFTPQNEKQMWSSFGAPEGQSVSKLAIGGADLPKQGSNVVDQGVNYLKFLLNNNGFKKIISYASDYIDQGLIDIEELKSEISQISAYSKRTNIPALKYDQQLGKHVDASKHGKVVNMRDLHKLMGQGFEWDFYSTKDVAFDKNPRGIMIPHKTAILVNHETGKQFVVKRKDIDGKEFYLADLTDPTVGDRNTKYKPDPVPYFMSGSRHSTIGGTYKKTNDDPSQRMNQQVDYSRFSNSPFGNSNELLNNSNYKIAKLKYASMESSRIAGNLRRISNPIVFSAAADVLISKLGPADPMIKQIMQLANEKGISYAHKSNVIGGVGNVGSNQEIKYAARNAKR